MTFTFLHAADLHLDTPFSGLATTNPALRAKLIDASLDAFDALVERALSERVLFVSLGGDIYDGTKRGHRAQRRLFQGLKRLDAAGIWTFMVHGNHDPLEEGYGEIPQWPERVHVFSADKAETRTLTAPDGATVTVTGTSYPTAHVHQGLHARFSRPTGRGFHVALLHATVGSTVEHEPYSPCTVEDLKSLGFDAWLLGHIHRRQILCASPFIAYPGNLQGRSFKPSETGAKGALLCEVRDGVVVPRFVPLAPVRFEEIVLTCEPESDLNEVSDLLLSQVRDVAGKGGTVVVRARLQGQHPAYGELLDDASRTQFLQALQDDVGRAGTVHWVDVISELRPPLDRASLAERDDLCGELVRELEALESDLVELRMGLGDHDGVAELLQAMDNEALVELASEAGSLALLGLRGEE